MNVLAPFSTNLLYGETQSTKTSRLGDIAEWAYRRTGKPSRLVSSDTGGWQSVQVLVDAKVIIPFPLTFGRKFLIQDMNNLSLGWWPRDPEDPLSELLPPPAWGKEWPVATTLFDGATTMARMQKQIHETSVEWDEATKTIRAVGVRVPEMPKDSYVHSGTTTWRSLGRSDYGSVQGRIEQAIKQSARLPIPTWWTALETKGQDEDRKPIYGPDFLGQALTGICGPWFSHFLHLDLVDFDSEIVNPLDSSRKLKILEKRPLLFLRSHVDLLDPLKLTYPAVVRVDRTLWKKLPPAVPPRMDKFFDLLESLQGGTVESKVSMSEKEEVTK